MTFLVSNPDNETDGGTLELDGASSIVSADVGGFTYVFVAGGVDDGISVFRLLANGTLTPVHDVTDDATLELDGARGLSTAMVDGNTYLFAAGQADNGVSVFRVNTNGSLTSVSNVTDDATMLLAGVSDTAAARVGASTYLFTAGTTENGISIFRVAGDGRLTYLSNQTDSGALELAGVRALTTVTIGATAFLIAGGTDDGISVFSINAGTGALTATANVDDTGAINLNDVSDITTAVIGGVTYVFIAGAADNGVSVYSLSAAGALTHIESESDSAASLIAGANSVTVTVLGGVTYLHVGGTESGTSLYLFDPTETAGRVLLHVDQIADSGSRELSGTTVTGTASVGGTTYLLGAGSTDDGVSTFGTQTTGQIWYTTEGNLTDARLSFFNTDGGNHVTFLDNNPGTTLTTGFVESVALDTAAGLYYVLVDGNEGINARLLMGHIGSAAAPTVVFTFDPTYAGPNLENNLAFGIEIDTINERLYIGYIEFNPTFGPTTEGIRQFNYNVTTGAVTGGTFFVTEASTPGGVPSSAPGGDGLFASRDLDIDTTHNVLYSQQLAFGNGFETNNILRFSLSAPGAGTVLLNPALFPMDGDGSDFTTLNGIIADIEVDEDSNRLYFLTRSEDVQEAGGEDSIWMVANASTAVNATPVKLTLVGVTQANFYPTDMIMDEVNNILYVESENSNVIGGGITDVILAFQLDAAGTTATLINTIDMRFNATANVEGLHFNYLATLSGLTATGTHAGEQGVAVDLLGVAPGIADFDGDHLASATIQVTGGAFNSNENSFNDDDLGVGAAMQQSGTIAGTNLTITWNQATGTLTLTGYDTFANYSAALNSIFFQSTGDNPTNYGLNPTRTITWTISDGSPGIPGGQQNSQTTSLTIDAVNDAPVNIVGATLGATEDAGIIVTGVSVSDPDANPGITDITVTLTVQHGTITLATNIAGGIVAGDITGGGNGTATITLTATLNEINATLTGSGLTYTPTGNYNGADSLQIVTNDGGNTGSGGPFSDTDSKTITIAAVNDAPVVIGDGTEVLTTILEDQPQTNLTASSVATLVGGQFSDAVDQQQTGGNPTGSVANTLAGIAVVSSGSSASGEWQYWNGATWVNIGAASLSSAHLLNAATLIRFNPALNFNGAVPALTVRLVDSSGAAITDNSVVDLSGGAATGGTTRYSAGTVVLSETVTAVNDAPVNVFPGTQTINEDASVTFSTGNGNAISVSDVDVGAGNLTVTLSIQSGVLTLSGTAGLAVSGNASNLVTLTGTAAAINTALNGLVYAPPTNFNGSRTLTVTTNDNGNTGQDPGGDPGSEQDVDTVTVNITAINDAPVVIGDGTESATTINEDAPGAGQTIQALFAGQYSDAADNQIPNGGASSPGQFSGIAVTANGSTAGTGQWQYFNGTIWVNIGPASDAAAVLLGDPFVTLIRFTPALNFNGPAPTLAVHLIDNSLGFGIVNGTIVNLSGVGATGGATAYSTGTVVLSQDVTAINDAPVNVFPGTQSINEDGSVTFSTGNANAISVSDVDVGAGNLTVTLSIADGALTLSGTAGLAVSGNASNLVTLTGTAAAINTALNGLIYAPPINSSGSRTLTVTTNDNGNTGNDPGGDPGSEQDVDTVTINIGAVNDTPVVTAAATGSSTEQVAGTIDATATISDIDLDALNGGNGNYAGATLGIANNGGADANDLFTFGTSGAFTVNGSNLEAGGLVFATFSGGNGSQLNITFTSSGTPATTALVNAVVQSIQYTYTGDSPPVAGIDVAIFLNDGAPANAGQGSTAGHPALGLDVIHLSITDTPENAPPVIHDLGGDTATFTEGDAAILIDDSSAPELLATVTDADDTEFNGGSLTVSITVNEVAGEDVLGISTAGTVTLSNGTNVGSVVSVGGLAVGTVTANGAGGNDLVIALDTTDATPANLSLLVQALTYFNSNTIQPSTLTRTLTVSVTDGNGGGISPQNVLVNVTGVNDEPTLVATAQNPVFPENTAAVDLFSAVTASTIETGQTITSMTLTVTNVTNGANEILSFDGSNVALTNGNSVVTAGNGLTVNVTVVGSTATATFSGATLTTAALQTLVDGLTYQNTSIPPTDGDRVVTITQLVDSGSNVAPNDNVATLSITSTVNVNPNNQAPVVDLDGGTGGVNYTASFTEDGAAVSIGSGVLVSDPDAGDMIESATITLTDRVAGDSLTLTGVLPPGIVAVTTSLAGSITIQITGSGTGAQYQALIESVLYATTSQDPGVGGTDLARTVTVTVNDGTVASAVATTTVNIVAQDDAAAAQPDAFTITESGTIVAGNLFANNGSGADGDPDGPPLAISEVNGSSGNVGGAIVLASGATLTVNANGTFDYNPNGAFLQTPTAGSGASNTPGHDMFTYTLVGGNTVMVAITLTGLDTNDLLLGTAGADALAGGLGNDTYVVDGADIVTELVGQGFDLVYATASHTLAVGSAVEVLGAIDIGATTAIDLTGNELSQQIIGNAGANTLTGGGGADALYGLGGNDVYMVDSADLVFEANGAGFDQVYAASSITLAAGAEVEVLSPTSWLSTMAIDITGNEYSQQIFGNAGANVLNGGGGSDALYGFGGNDTYIVDINDVIYEDVGGGFDQVYSATGYALVSGVEVEVLSAANWAGTGAFNFVGNSFSQQIYGNAGVNKIDGRDGTDLLYGFGGADTFQFTTALGGNNVDTIADFSAVDDTIQLHSSIFTAIFPLGALAPSAFHVGTGATDEDQRIIYDDATGNLFYDADGSGGQEQVLFAILQGAPTITAADFTVTDFSLI